ncbi:hypothetical protein BO78DRAFT_66264 [Aspergillus sclerotiicarbonarius CBS 121057]|uniref:Uncharacterized protein n=1 Tax=Aspergillus sclerotiicarbonarius (strain CBS 121057 / IBT 28362) TaxID=1448318 RepID=A0A319F7E6_ASPSB|nr:hypothetical protein BO78DRAFT_66264 [Aspergillus sclerotiicarbonarius CBS 121057]
MIPQLSVSAQQGSRHSAVATARKGQEQSSRVDQRGPGRVPADAEQEHFSPCSRLATVRGKKIPKQIATDRANRVDARRLGRTNFNFCPKASCHAKRHRGPLQFYLEQAAGTISSIIKIAEECLVDRKGRNQERPAVDKRQCLPLRKLRGGRPSSFISLPPPPHPN